LNSDSDSENSVDDYVLIDTSVDMMMTMTTTMMMTEEEEEKWIVLVILNGNASYYRRRREVGFAVQRVAKNTNGILDIFHR
jgi:hypothetical protein